MLTFKAFLRDTGGATSIEYCLIAGFIALVLVTAVKTAGTNLTRPFSRVAGNL